MLSEETSIQLPILLTIIGVLIALSTYSIGRTQNAKKEGRTEGIISNQLETLTKAVDNLDKTISASTARQEAKMEMLSGQYNDLNKKMAAVGEQALMAHRRIEEHLEREHCVKIKKEERIEI